jgi:predicted Zn-dependent protease
MSDSIEMLQLLEEGSHALAAGSTSEALAHYQRVSAAPDPAIALAGGLGVAVSLARQSRWSEADVVLSDLAARFPASGIARAYLAAVRFEQGAVAEAQRFFAEAAALEPEAAIVFVKRGEMQVRLGLLREGLADLQRASRLGGLDEQTREHVRGLLLAVRRQMATSLDRPVPRLSRLWQRIGGEARAATAPVDLPAAIHEGRQ